MSEQESSTPASPWETAHEADRRSRMERRTAAAQADIAAARADPSFVVYEGAPPRGDNLDTRAIDPARLPEGTILLSGPQAERYRALEAAAKRSLAAQTELTAAGAELRDAISGLCQALAPPG